NARFSGGTNRSRGTSFMAAWIRGSVTSFARICASIILRRCTEKEDIDSARPECAGLILARPWPDNATEALAAAMAADIRTHPPEATWRSGYAAVCKTVYSGSIPDVASSSHAPALRVLRFY